MSTSYAQLTDEELREEFNTHAMREGIATTIYLVVGVSIAVIVLFSSLAGNMNWTDSQTWMWLGPSLAVIAVGAFVSVVNAIKLRKIGEVQSERGRKYLSAVRRGRSYDPFEKVTLSK